MCACDSGLFFSAQITCTRAIKKRYSVSRGHVGSSMSFRCSSSRSARGRAALSFHTVSCERIFAAISSAVSSFSIMSAISVKVFCSRDLANASPEIPSDSCRGICVTGNLFPQVCPPISTTPAPPLSADRKEYFTLSKASCCKMSRSIMVACCWMISISLPA